MKLASGDIQGAKEDCQKFIDAKPNDPSAWNQTGLIFAKAKTFDHAIHDFTREKDMKGNCHVPYMNRGTCYQEKGNTLATIRDFSKALEIKPRFAASYFKRAKVYESTGDLNKAIADYQSALKLFPHEPNGHLRLGIVLKKTGRTQLATSHLKRALEIANATGNKTLFAAIQRHLK